MRRSPRRATQSSLAFFGLGSFASVEALAPAILADAERVYAHRLGEMFLSVFSPRSTKSASISAANVIVGGARYANAARFRDAPPAARRY